MSSICLVAILRLVALIHLTDKLVGQWGGLSLAEWAAIEMYVAIICSSLPLMWPLARRLSTSVAFMVGKERFQQLRLTERAAQ